tara:strand:+ start:354 stop:632 length:279 start_codon:yes stop_codon:yes gene_type:complete
VASSFSVASDLYAWACGNPSRILQIRNSFNSGISAGALTKGGMNSFSGGTKNGVSASVTNGLSEGERITALRTALAYLEAGYPPSSRTRASF